MAMASPLQGWHSRALQTPHPSPHSFTATRESLILTVLLNAQAETEGITLALFAEPPTGRTIAVDALGRVSIVAPKDFNGILSLAKRALALPDTGTWRNTWVIKHVATSQPIHRIFVSPQRGPSGAGSDVVTTVQEGTDVDVEVEGTAAAAKGVDTHVSIAGDLKQISVQGFSKTTKELKDPIKGRHELPNELWELTGLLLEAREGAGQGVRRDDLVLDKVRSIVNPLFI